MAHAGALGRDVPLHALRYLEQLYGKKNAGKWFGENEIISDISVQAHPGKESFFFSFDFTYEMISLILGAFV